MKEQARKEIDEEERLSQGEINDIVDKKVEVVDLDAQLLTQKGAETLIN